MGHLDAVKDGIALTLLLTLSAFSLGAVGAVPVLFMRRSRWWLLRGLSRIFVEVLRGIPPVVVLFIVYFGIGSSLLQLRPLPAAIIGLSFITAAYLSEIYRGALSAIDVGQWEAARVLRLSPTSTWTSVIGPQLVRISVPAAASWGIGLLKDSSLAATIGVAEIVYHAKNDASLTASPMAPFIWAGLIYVVISVPAGAASRVLDHKLRARVAR
jgi:polar amino acid transport system permease protein